MYSILTALPMVLAEKKLSKIKEITREFLHVVSV